MDTNCPSCSKQVRAEWNYCANCGLKFHLRPDVAKHKEKENSTRKIAERFLLLANDYRSLTGHILEGEVLQSFINNAASSTLSVIDAEKRMQAGRKSRKSLGNGKYSLNLAEWLEAVYEIREPRMQSRVWITTGGAKYHTDPECTAFSSGQEFARWKGKDTYKPEFVEIRYASFVLGLSPCLVCKPPTYHNSKN